MDRSDLRITTRLIYDELVARKISVEILSTKSSLLRYYYQEKWHYLRSTLSDKEAAIPYVIAQNKQLTGELCGRLGILYPKSSTNVQEASELLSECGRVVVKPLAGAHGDGVSLDVVSEAQLQVAIEWALRFNKNIIIQQQMAGDDYRVLMIDGRYVAALRRIPAQVIGDGVSTLRECIARENQDPSRGENYTTSKEKISLDVAARYLGDRLDSEIPAFGEAVRVVDVPNLSAGGDAEDRTDNVPEAMIRSAELIVGELGMGICGVDFIWDGEDTPYLIEINATPGIDMHDMVQFGAPRGAVSAFVDYLLAD